MGLGAVMLLVYAAYLRDRERVENAVTASALSARDPAGQGLPIVKFPLPEMPIEAV